MKNRFKNFLLILIYSFFTLKSVYATEPFVFNVTEIEILENGNKINGYNGGTAISEDGSEITAKNFFYNKITNILEAIGDVRYSNKINNITIVSDKAIYLKNEEKILKQKINLCVCVCVCVCAYAPTWLGTSWGYPFLNLSFGSTYVLYDTIR